MRRQRQVFASLRACRRCGDVVSPLSPHGVTQQRRPEAFHLRLIGRLVNGQRQASGQVVVRERVAPPRAR